MADHHNHHQQHRPNRLSLPARSIGRAYPSFPYTPTPTPSKTRTRSIHGTTKSSISFLLLILFSLRSLYSLLPFLRSSPSFSLFPFTFLVSLLSFVFSLAFTLFSPSKKDSFLRHNRTVFSITLSQTKLILAKSGFLAVVFLLRFQALRYCSAAAMILAELSGTVSARVLSESRNHHGGAGSSKVRGFCILFAGLLLLSISWDRVDCFPFSSSSVKNCLRIWPMLLPFLSGFLGCYEKVSMNWVEIKQLDQKRVRLITLFLTTVLLFPLALWSFVESDEAGVSFGNLGWPLANTVVFGVLLSESYNDDKLKKDSEREFLVTFLCTIVLELFYFPELSLWGLLLCGFLLYVAVRELDSSDYQEIGMESPESFSTVFMKPIRHILSEKKSRKIALFLLINTAYMVVEFVAGFMSNSLGLISDACHMLFDCAALAIGLYASYISRLPANHQFNYGRGRFEVLSGYVNAVFLVLVGALIVLESIERILDPQEISTSSLLVVSVGGLLVNVVGLIFFHEEHHHAHGGGSGCTHSHSHQSHKHEEHHEHDHHQHHSHSHKHEEHHDHDDHQHHSHNHKNEESHECNHNHDHHHHSHSHTHQEHHEDNHSHGNDHGHHHHSDHKSAKGEIKEHHHIDHNMEGIFLHVLADTMGSVGVVVSTLLIKYKGWLVADPASSIFISILIIASVIPLLRNSAGILLQRVPKAHEHDLREAMRNILKTKGVCSIQRLHVWSFTNSDVVATLHLLVSDDSDKTDTKLQVSRLLEDAGVKDLTLQVEFVNS
ncbi:PREDICTED: probable zinc transporter protein DDB_G0291141 [Brassica oleracea var. oleracea]|uniref:Cation efflux protein transmembrane domain-containing protein n=1 Tax=Brassica oleracea var. oleracea TaxID=109376 RepID=A0A0D3BZZ7_BRAOL|nr:PREDICTED: probable zinc transporter protein DDB_G0291141 [Brassica oleracea var. oleracea]